MKKYILQFKFLIIALLLIMAATISERNALQPEDYQVDTAYFRKVLLEKQEKVDTLLSYIHTLVKPLAKQQDVDFFKTLWSLDLDALKKNGNSVFVYLNDTLRFWSNNSIEVSLKYSDTELNNTVLNLNNAWYYVRHIHDRNLEIYGLIELRSDFSYENKYLTNAFREEYKMPPSVKISKISVSHSYDIKDKENVYLFSLEPINTAYSKNENWGYIAIMYFLGLAFLLIFLNKWIKQTVVQQNNPVPFILLMLAFILFARYLMLEFKYPIQIYTLPVFDEPEHFAGSYLFPSLGDFFINSLLILFYARSVFYVFRPGKITRFFRNKKQPVKLLFGFALFLLVILYFNYAIQLLESLVINSSLPLEAHKILKLNLFSFVAYSIFGILFSALIIILDKSLFVMSKILTNRQAMLLIGTTLLLYAMVVLVFDMYLSAGSLIYFFVLVAILAYIYLKRRKYSYSLYVLLIIIGSVYITIFINNTISEKEKGKAGVLMSKIVNERDRVGEHLLIGLEQRLQSDAKLKRNILVHEDDQLDKIHNLLKKKYFGGYFSKYELDFVVCSNHESYDESKQLASCAKYYGGIIEKYGKKIDNSNFYYIDNHNGRVSYQGAVNFDMGTGKSRYTLYFTLDSKLETEEIGYPDLLIAQKEKKQDPLRDYSYAKYKKGKLVTRSGNFPYDLSDNMFKVDSGELAIVHYPDFEHYIKEINKTKIILSKEKTKGFDLVIAFSYIFVFFNIMLVLSLLTNSFTSLRHQIKFNFENKLMFAMLFVLVLSFAMVTAGTVYYNSSQFAKKHNASIKEKLETVLKHLQIEEDKKRLPDSLFVEKNRPLLNETLKEFSNVYYTDINLYNESGKLVGTSRPEVFSRGLIGSLMDPEAFRQMTINSRTRFVQDERIGELQYSSAYALFANNKGNRNVFVNLPYFTKPAELSKELSHIVVAIINLYVVLFILIALVSFFMASKITQPLRMLQSRFQKIELGKQSEQIEYDKKDEVGALVEEYNRMVIKLEESIALLAKNERESAWREMAKQIAHEIKNPLTPMKLSVQFLQRAWQNKDGGFEKKLNKSTQTLIDQITTLTNIANEFSNFAKMPKPKQEEVDLVVRVGQIIELFGTDENVTIESNIEEFDKLVIIADNEHISRVITNLVKNAIQAIPPNREGLIKAVAEKNNGKVTLKIIDNGSGIADEQKEKLFVPNFTTKSSGMGMGLPIVKDIVESANGKIWFESELGAGTTFFVEFPLAKKSPVN